MATEAPLQPTAIHGQTGPIFNAHASSPAASSTAGPGYTILRGTVTAKLNFYEAPADGSPPHNYVEDPPVGQPKFNFRLDNRAVEISDLRGKESDFTLDRNAFETISSVPPSAESAWTDDDSIKRNYYPEVEKLLLDNLPGAHTVVLFDHTIRRSHPGAARAPVTHAHIDQTPWSAAERVRLHCPPGADAETLLAGRYRIVNVWRPLNGPVAAHPLAVADSSTVRDEDLVSVEHRYPHRTGQTARVRWGEGQRWWYWSGMTNEERLLLKCFDSDEEWGRRGRVPHTAFVDPRTPGDAPGRESIEVRALVFG